MGSAPDDNFITPEILLEDGPVLAVNKPAGLLTEGLRPPLPTLVNHVKAYLKAAHEKPGNVYLGVPHRIDRVASGVVIFARNSKAAARLAEQFRERQVRKIYWAIVERPPAEPEGELVDLIEKVTEIAQSRLVSAPTPISREARLKYRTLATVVGGCLLEIELGTGRHHQIRVQLAARGSPIVGDRSYGATRDIEPVDEAVHPAGRPIALHARELTFLHPIRYDAVRALAPIPNYWGALGVDDAFVSSLGNPDPS